MEIHQEYDPLRVLNRSHRFVVRRRFDKFSRFFYDCKAISRKHTLSNGDFQIDVLTLVVKDDQVQMLIFTVLINPAHVVDKMLQPLALVFYRNSNVYVRVSLPFIGCRKTQSASFFILKNVLRHPEYVVVSCSLKLELKEISCSFFWVNFLFNVIYSYKMVFSINKELKLVTYCYLLCTNIYNSYKKH